MKSKLEILKQKIITARNLSEPAHYFLDHFPGKYSFEEGSKKITGPEKQQLAAILKATVGKRFKITKGKRMSILLRYQQSHFIHGFINFPNLLCTVMYFEDAMIGLITCIKPTSQNRVEYLRFNGFMMDNPIDPTGNNVIISTNSNMVH